MLTRSFHCIRCFGNLVLRQRLNSPAPAAASASVHASALGRGSIPHLSLSLNARAVSTTTWSWPQHDSFYFADPIDKDKPVNLCVIQTLPGEGNGIGIEGMLFCTGNARNEERRRRSQWS